MLSLDILEIATHCYYIDNKLCQIYDTESIPDDKSVALEPKKYVSKTHADRTHAGRTHAGRTHTGPVRR